ncbi:DNA polymerase III subunit epsilon [Simiduia litorea]
MRQIVLDTETTGLEPSQGHRIIEIGCVELVNRKLTGRHYHQYINPEREVDAGAMEVHGISNEFLVDKPTFTQIADDFLAYVDGAELIIHNAPFDVGFINNEFRLLGDGKKPIAQYCGILDTLAMARNKHPGQKNNLDALCKRYGVDNSQRDLHGALLDAEILADVYLLMTGGQEALSFAAANEQKQQGGSEGIRRLSAARSPLPVILAAQDELDVHHKKLEKLQKASGACVWLQAGD